MQKLGADYVIDYTRENISANGKKYDLIIAAAGYTPLSVSQQALSEAGIYIVTGGSSAQIFEPMFRRFYTRKKRNQVLTNLYQKPETGDLSELREMIEGTAVIPLIDRIFQLEDSAAALEYYAQGHSQGKVVIKIRREE